VAEFKAWLVIWLIMGTKQQPNIMSYWMKKKFSFSLSYHFKNYVMWPPFHGFDKMFSCYKSYNIYEREGFAKI
jgi:hypothetical protein